MPSRCRGQGNFHLELRHNGAVPDVEEVRERERLRRLAAFQERRSALVEVPRHPAVQLGSPGRHGGPWGQPRKEKKMRRISQPGAAEKVGQEGLRRITRDCGSIRVHGRAAQEEEEEEEDGGR